MYHSIIFHSFSKTVNHIIYFHVTLLMTLFSFWRVENQIVNSDSVLIILAILAVFNISHKIDGSKTWLCDMKKMKAWKLYIYTKHLPNYFVSTLFLCKTIVLVYTIFNFLYMLKWCHGNARLLILAAFPQCIRDKFKKVKLLVFNSDLRGKYKLTYDYRFLYGVKDVPLFCGIFSLSVSMSQKWYRTSAMDSYPRLFLEMAVSVSSRCGNDEALRVESGVQWSGNF